MIDWLLAFLLILALPGWAIWKSLRQRGPSAANRMRRYLMNDVRIVVLLLLLATSWLSAGRTWSQLGLGWPFTRGAAIGLAIFVALVAIFSTRSHLRTRELTAEAKSELEAKAPASDLMPHTTRELAAFLPLALLLGCGWELLYRGFLWWFLAPRVGANAAVCIAALAYGLAHGIKGPRQTFGSVLMAFAFMVAFVQTQNLWWLILVHVAVALIGGITTWNKARRSDTVAPTAEA